MLVDAGRGLSPNLKVGYQPTSGRVEDATLVPTWAVGRESHAGSQIVILPDTQGGVFEGVSLGTPGG